MAELWLETDECEDVASSIRHCIFSLEVSKSDLHAFKWVILSLHSALQGSCVCHLVTTAAPVGATTKRNTAEWLAYFSSRDDGSVLRPDTKIADLPELLKRIRRRNSAGNNSQGSEIKLNDSTFLWWKRIHERTRNQFVHFAPMSWSIELSGIPALVGETVQIIREIDEKGWAFRHMVSDWQNDFQVSLSRLDALASNWDRD